MRKAIFILILLTIGVCVQAQDRPAEPVVRVVFTTNYQHNLFGYDPVWRNWPDGSLSRALTYIGAYRREMGGERFALLNSGTELSAAIRLYPEDAASRAAAYAGYETAPVFQRNGIVFHTAVSEEGKMAEDAPAGAVRIGLLAGSDTGSERMIPMTEVDIAVVASGREPEVRRAARTVGDTVTVINLGTTGKYIGVADFYSATDFAVKLVEVSGFPADAEYEAHFRPLTDSLQAFFDEPLTVVNNTLSQEGFLFGPTPYTALFHRFQQECAGTVLSFFASPLVRDSIPAGELTFGDIVRRFRYENRLCVVRLTLDEIKRYLEYAYGLRYNTVRRSTDDLLRLTRDRDGVLQTRSAVYNLDEAGGIRYEVDVSRPQGRRIRILSLSDGAPIPESGFHAVALNSHRIESGYLSRACGLSPEQIRERLAWESEADYRLVLREWMTYSQIYSPEEGNWRVIPESFVREVKERVLFE